jgi:hypothetical protein
MRARGGRLARRIVARVAPRALALFMVVTFGLAPVASAHAAGARPFTAHNGWLIIEPTRSSRPADGIAPFTATVVVASQDENRKAIQGAQVGFQAIPHVTFSAPNCMTDDSGTCSVTFTSTRPGRIRIKAIIRDTGVRLSLTPVVFTAVH